jgi:hypothetical protein
LQVQGRTDEAVREVQKAAQLDLVNLCKMLSVIPSTLRANTPTALGHPFLPAAR